MSRKLLLLAVALLTLVVGNALAATKTFTNGDPCDNNWNIASNWDAGVPVSGDAAYIPGNAAGAIGPVIDSNVDIGTVSTTNVVYLGTAATGTAKLTVEGGIVKTARVYIGRTVGYTGVVDYNTATWNTAGSPSTWYIGGNPGNGILNMGSGTIYADDLMCPYGGTAATGQLNMTGGIIYVKDDFKLDGPGTVHLDGGKIEQIGSPFGYRSTNDGEDGEFLIGYGSSIDITGGRLILNGDARGAIDGSVTVLENITGYGDTDNVYWDYNVTTAGKTTVWAETDPRPDYFIETTKFSDNFGTSAFDKSKWTGSANWVSSTNIPPGTAGYSVTLPASKTGTSSITMASGINTTGAAAILVDFWCQDDDLDAGEFSVLFNSSGSGSSVFVAYQALDIVTEDQWTHFTAILTDPKYMFDGFKVRFNGGPTASGENAWIDEVIIMARYSTIPTNASFPSPIDGAKYEPISSQLSWMVGQNIVSHDVYLGTNFDDIEAARDDSELCVSDNQPDANYNPTLEYGTTYYWRVDGNFGGANPIKGDVWSFTTISEEEIPSDSNLIGWWMLDDDAGIYAWDYSGNGHSGTFANQAAIVSDPCGIRGNILALDGDGDYVDVGNGDWTNPGDNMTISAWFKTASVGFDASNETIMAKGTSYRLSREATYNYLSVFMNYTSGSNRGAIGVTNVNDRKWHHSAVTYDGATMKIYVDGTVDGTNTLSTLYPTGDPLIIGRNSVAAARDWNGWIDDVRLYNRSLSDIEVRALAGNSTAYNFSPANNAITLVDVLLDWDSVAESPLYNVYLSSDFNDVNDSVPSALVADNNSLSSYQATGLALNTIYYWAVDVNDNGTMYPADIIMSFKTASTYAAAPSPANESMYIAAPTVLSWTASDIMQNQDVYFGTNFDLVEGRDNDCLIADNTTDSNCAIGTLIDGVTYYWLVDTNSSEGVHSQGIWSFTAAIVTDSSLIGWWKMEDASSGAMCWDYSGNMHHGTFLGTASIGKDAERSNVLILANGSGGDANFPDANAVSCGNGSWAGGFTQMTITCWAKIDTFNADYQYIMSKEGSWRIMRYNFEDKMRFYTNSNSLVGSVDSDIQGGDWHHVACTYGTAGKKLYIDGRLDASNATSVAINNSTNNMIIGGTTRIDSSYRWWNGAIDDVRLYNRTLSQEEIWTMLSLEPDVEYLKLVINNWLNTGPAGDLNGDDIVDLLDFNIMAQQWNYQNSSM